MKSKRAEQKIETKHHYIRKLVVDERCKLVQIPTKTNTADMSTKILPAKTVSVLVFSKVVLGLEGTSTDDFLQLLSGDTPYHNWGVMSDTTYPLSQY
jgi:hypothetical protein